jgi:general secretion pathway protein M
MVYLLCFHWFILRHLDYNSEIADLSDQLGRFERVAAQRTEYETLLQALQERKADENLFLSGNDFNEAAAGMSERLSQMITVQADDSCQIVSRQPVRPRVQERFEKVTVNVRMRCGVEDLKKVLHSLETGVPMIIADEVTVIKPRSRRRRSSNQNAASGVLDIRFNMSGYLRDST